MFLENTIKELCDLSGPSGFEESVSKRAADLLRPYMDEVQTDVLGNVIGVRRCGIPGAKKLLIDTHIDEIGFVITGIQDGFLRFSSLGGVDSRNLPAAEIKILTEPALFGFVACMPPHVLSADEMDKPVKIEDMCIDIGMTQEEALIAVPLGTPAVFAQSTVRLTEEMICGKALDDRACFAAVLYGLELLRDTSLQADLFVMASVQEEVGCRGARTGAYGIRPDYAVVLDVTHAHTPDSKKEKTTVMGDGVAIGIGSNMNRTMTEDMVKVAKRRGLPYQMEVLPGSSGTNAAEVQISREGVATALLSLPLKYMHSPVEMIRLSDAAATSRLLAAYLAQFGGEGLEIC